FRPAIRRKLLEPKQGCTALLLGVHDLGNDRRLLPGVLLEDQARRAADLIWPALTPVEFDEFGSDVLGFQVEGCAGVLAFHNGKMRQGVNEGELEAGDEQPCGQQSLDVS